MSSSALSGICVLDLTRLLPGPMATRHLVDLGARVIKVQSPNPDLGDYAKTMGTSQDMDGEASYFYRHCNQGKSELFLDLKRPEDRTALLELVKTADVVLESFRPGVMAKLGLDFDSLLAVNPRIGLVSITGYGQNGAWAHLAGHDINYMALSGQLSEFCTPQSEVCLPNVQYGDLLGGAITAALASLAAVLHGKIQGRGCWMDVSMTASLLAHAIMPLAAVQAHGEAPQATQALLNGGVACYRVYATLDGKHLAVGALELKFWQLFCQTLGQPEWALQHWSLGSHAPGDALAQTLIAQVAAHIGSQTLDFWLTALADADCCCTPVLTMAQALQHSVNTDFGTVGYRKTALGSNIPTVGAAFKQIA